MSNATHIYLDYNATAPLRPEVKEAMCIYLSGPEFGNPSSVHHFGRGARHKIDVAREQIARSVGAQPSQIIFTSGGTEANMLAISGSDSDLHLYSSVCHPSVLKATQKSVSLPVDENGLVILSALEEKLKQAKEKILVSVSYVNNETGVIQPLDEISTLIHQYGAGLHVDAVQAYGKLPLDFKGLNIDFMSISSHKIGGPLGVGALIAKDRTKLNPLMRGGGQEYGYRSGTENVMCILGFGKFAEIIESTFVEQEKIGSMRLYIEEQISQYSQYVDQDKKPVIFGQMIPRVQNTSFIAMPGVEAQLQLMHFDLQKIAVATGSACSSGKVKTSHILQSIGVCHEVAKTALRVSLGWNTTLSDVKKFMDCWSSLFRMHHQIDSMI